MAKAKKPQNAQHRRTLTHLTTNSRVFERQGHLSTDLGRIVAYTKANQQMTVGLCVLSAFHVSYRTQIIHLDLARTPPSPLHCSDFNNVVLCRCLSTHVDALLSLLIAEIKNGGNCATVKG